MPNKLSGWECRHCQQRFDKREAAERHEQSHMTTITVSGDPTPRTEFRARDLHRIVP